jgi:hypothetical protein
MIRPEGTVESALSAVPPGLDVFALSNPSAEALGYCRMSLRDKDVAASIHFFRDNDGLAFSWLDNSLRRWK